MGPPREERNTMQQEDNGFSTSSPCTTTRPVQKNATEMQKRKETSSSKNDFERGITEIIAAETLTSPCSAPLQMIAKRKFDGKNM